MNTFPHALVCWLLCGVLSAMSVGFPGNEGLVLLWLSGLSAGLATMFLVLDGKVTREDRPETARESEDEGPDPGNYCCQCGSPHTDFDQYGDEVCNDCGKPVAPF